MRNAIIIFVVICFGSMLLFAISGLPLGEVSIKVINEKGNVITNAEVTVYFTDIVGNGMEIISTAVSGKTDTNGFFQAKAITMPRISVVAKKTGYYESKKRISMKTKGTERKYLPYDITLILKEIINPIPMYAKRLK